MRVLRPIQFLVLFDLLCLLPRSAWAASDPASARWSVQLLSAGEPTSSDATARPTAGPAASKQSGMVLRTYQLKYLSLGEGGRSRSLLGLVEKLLPEGSEVKQDLAANSLHILTSVSAHAAVWDFISSLDVKPVGAAPAGPQPLPEELREGLKRLEAARPDTEKLQRSVDALRSELSGLAEGAEKSKGTRPRFFWLATVLAGAGLCVIIFLRRRSSRRRAAEAAAEKPVPSVAALLVPQQITSALEPMQRQLQQEMLGALNAAAARMEVWYKDQKAQRDQLVQLASEQETRLSEVRSQLLEENRELFRQTNARFEESAQRIEQGVQTLSQQNDRVGALAGELSQTVRELDTTKDRLLQLRQELEQKSAQLDNTRETLSSREGELARQQAKLAALTLILEEGGGRTEVQLSSDNLPSSENAGAAPDGKSDSRGSVRGKLRFRFLPPEPKFL